MNSSLDLPRLPQAISRMRRGRLQALACDDEALRLVLVGAALRSALESGQHCIVLTRSEPEDFLSDARLAGARLDDAWRDARLRVLRQAPEALERLRVRGIRDLIETLEGECASRAAFVLFDDTRALLSLTDPRQCRALLGQLSRWAEAGGHALLALLNAGAASPRERVTVSQVADALAGLAHVRIIGARRILEVPHWDGQGDRTRTDERPPLQLELTQQGELRSQPLTGRPGAAPRGLRATTNANTSTNPRSTIVASRASFDVSPSGLSPLGEQCEWHWVDSPLDVGRESRRLGADCALLAYGGDLEFEPLSRLVVALRADTGSGLHIVVRERGARLRLPMALTLLQLGVSLIIPQGVTDLSALMSVQPLLGRAFRRACDDEVLRVSAEYRSELQSQPRDAIEFRSSVERLLALTDAFELQHSLVRLYARNGCMAPAMEGLRAQGRDLLAVADGTQLWLFLFACPRTDVRAVLDRLYGERLQQLFSDWSISADPERMLAALESIRLPERRRPAVQALAREAAAA